MGEGSIGEFTTTITAYRCRCGHEWIGRSLHNTERPRLCPKCKSPHWDKPYRWRREDAQKVATTA